MSTGKVVQIIGAVVDVEFPREAIPNIYDALIAKEMGQPGHREPDPRGQRARRRWGFSITERAHQVRDARVDFGLCIVAYAEHRRQRRNRIGACAGLKRGFDDCVQPPGLRRVEGDNTRSA